VKQLPLYTIKWAFGIKRRELVADALRA
jgi:hypothetical protein